MSSANVVTGIVGFALTVLARILVAVLTAIVVKFSSGTAWAPKNTQIFPNTLYFGELY